MRWRELLEKVQVWAAELASKLASRGVRVSKVILFGSIARGDYTLDSDVDLIVVSNDWRGLPLTERLSLLYLLWDKPIDANFIALTEEELEDKIKTSVALRDASSYWIIVYSSVER